MYCNSWEHLFLWMNQKSILKAQENFISSILPALFLNASEKLVYQEVQAIFLSNIGSILILKFSLFSTSFCPAAIFHSSPPPWLGCMFDLWGGKLYYTTYPQPPTNLTLLYNPLLWTVSPSHPLSHQFWGHWRGVQGPLLRTRLCLSGHNRPSWLAATA